MVVKPLCECVAHSERGAIALTVVIRPPRAAKIGRLGVCFFSLLRAAPVDLLTLVADSGVGVEHCRKSVGEASGYTVPEQEHSRTFLERRCDIVRRESHERAL